MMNRIEEPMGERSAVIHLAEGSTYQRMAHVQDAMRATVNRMGLRASVGVGIGPDAFLLTGTNEELREAARHLLCERHVMNITFCDDERREEEERSREAQEAA
jgi:hypothetical protein